MTFASPQKMQEVLTVLRIVLDTQKIFNYMPLHALAFRAPPAWLDAADWLVHQLNEPQGPGNHVRAGPSAGDDVMRVFFLPRAGSADLQADLAAVRTQAQIAKAFPTTQPAALVVRGTAAQVDSAAKILEAR